MRRIILFVFLQLVILRFTASAFAGELPVPPTIDDVLKASGVISTAHTKHIRATIFISDCDTNEPVWGARAEVSYDKEVEDILRCKDSKIFVTQKSGKAEIRLKVDNCPISGEEDLYVHTWAPGYADNSKRIKEGKNEICLIKIGYVASKPPLQIEYPEYAIDHNTYNNNFHKLKSVLAGKKPENYFEREFSFAESFGNNNFIHFLKHVRYISETGSIALLNEILDKSYQLPFKRIIYDENESPRVDEYYYQMGNDYVAKALLNISDDAVNELLLRAVDISKEYIEILKQAGIELTPEDYWEYLSGRYSSRVHNPLIGMPPRSDQLTFVLSKLKEELSTEDYILSLVKLYQKTHALSADKNSERLHFWKYDEDRIARELFNFKSPEFTSEVKKLLPEMTVNDTTREYILYLYGAKEYGFLVETIPGKPANKKLMRAFLGLDIIDSRENPPRYYFREQENEEKKTLISKMPIVTSKIEDKIKHFLRKESKRGHRYYSWWIQNLAAIDKKEAERLSKHLYSKAREKDEKNKILIGAAGARLTELCSEVYEDLRIKDDLKRDYFSAGPSRIIYLNSSCPAQMQEFIADFDYDFLKEKERDRYFEPNYSYGMDFRDSIWEAITKYFPEEKTNEIWTKNICSQTDKKKPPRLLYLPNKVPLNCICERLEEYISSGGHVRSPQIDYLESCYPEKRDEYHRLRMTATDRAITDKTYQGFFSMAMGPKRRNGYESPMPLWDVRFRAFFLGSGVGSKKLKGYIDWSVGMNSDKALPLLDQALNSDEENMRQAALYAYSFYPGLQINQIMRKLRYYASQDKFPEYLYAAYSISASSPHDSVISAACKKSAKYHINEINSRSLARSKSRFAFNALLTLQTCGAASDNKNYLKLLELILKDRNLGRYDTFMMDLERIILSTDISVNDLISEMIESSDSIDIITAIRLAQLKGHLLNSKHLEILLENDDSYVRLATAKYIISRKEDYPAIFGRLMENSNRRVRNLGKSID